YRAGVPIIVRLDSGFFDQKLFAAFEQLGIGYICGGKLLAPIKEYVGQSIASEAQWGRYEQGRQSWEYLEFGSRCRSWKRFRRALFCRPLYEDRQMLLSFARPETVLITNLGMGQGIDDALLAAGYGHWLEANTIIAAYHGRGNDELVHRALKDFGFEQLPFKRFAPNAALYYTMLVSFFLYEAFKRDVCAPALSPVCYASTLRRRIIDIAAKIVRHGGRTVLNPDFA
ncbi:MAG: IS1380 family transposase, partial [Bacteroidetes bacterium]